MLRAPCNKRIAVYTLAKQTCPYWVLCFSPASRLKCSALRATSELQFTPLPNKLVPAGFCAFHPPAGLNALRALYNKLFADYFFAYLYCPTKSPVGLDVLHTTRTCSARLKLLPEPVNSELCIRVNHSHSVSS